MSDFIEIFFHSTCSVSGADIFLLIGITWIEKAENTLWSQGRKPTVTSEASLPSAVTFRRSSTQLASVDKVSEKFSGSAQAFHCPLRARDTRNDAQSVAQSSLGRFWWMWNIRKAGRQSGKASSPVSHLICTRHVGVYRVFSTCFHRLLVLISVL